MRNQFHEQKDSTTVLNCQVLKKGGKGVSSPAFKRESPRLRFDDDPRIVHLQLDLIKAKLDRIIVLLEKQQSNAVVGLDGRVQFPLPAWASASETAKRVPVINDPVITEALSHLDDDEPSELQQLRDELELLKTTCANQAETITGLETALSEYEDSARRVLAEDCAPDEQHCSCVPHLRAEIERLSGEVTDLEAKYARLWDARAVEVDALINQRREYFAAYNQLRQRTVALEQENAAMRQLLDTIANTANWDYRYHAGGEADMVWIGRTDLVSDAYRVLIGRFPSQS